MQSGPKLIASFEVQYCQLLKILASWEGNLVEKDWLYVGKFYSESGNQYMKSWLDQSKLEYKSSYIVHKIELNQVFCHLDSDVHQMLQKFIFKGNYITILVCLIKQLQNQGYIPDYIGAKKIWSRICCCCKVK